MKTFLRNLVGIPLFVAGLIVLPFYFLYVLGRSFIETLKARNKNG